MTPTPTKSDENIKGFAYNCYGVKIQGRADDDGALLLRISKTEEAK